jgi:hypothetical protein
MGPGPNEWQGRDPAQGTSSQGLGVVITSDQFLLTSPMEVVG